jgi:hypothetical protein
MNASKTISKAKSSNQSQRPSFSSFPPFPYVFGYFFGFSQGANINLKRSHPLFCVCYPEGKAINKHQSRPETF